MTQRAKAEIGKKLEGGSAILIEKEWRELGGKERGNLKERLSTSQMRGAVGLKLPQWDQLFQPQLMEIKNMLWERRSVGMQISIIGWFRVWKFYLQVFDAPIHRAANGLQGFSLLGCWF